MYHWILYTFVLMPMCAVFVSLVLWKYHHLKSMIVIKNEHYMRLLKLAERSLETSDVPVGAILLYKGEIIGEGFNTVMRNEKAGEHAEINAISSAIRSLGMEKFTLLERDVLFLATTFEPCMMCAGAFINYNIRNVFFMKEKDFSYTAKEDALFVRYLLRRKQIKSGGEQDELFEKHPNYPQKKK